MDGRNKFSSLSIESLENRCQPAVSGWWSVGSSLQLSDVAKSPAASAPFLASPSPVQSNHNTSQQPQTSADTGDDDDDPAGEDFDSDDSSSITAFPQRADSDDARSQGNGGQDLQRVTENEVSPVPGPVQQPISVVSIGFESTVEEEAMAAIAGGPNSGSTTETLPGQIPQEAAKGIPLLDIPQDPPPFSSSPSGKERVVGSALLVPETIDEHVDLFQDFASASRDSARDWSSELSSLHDDVQEFVSHLSPVTLNESGGYLSRDGWLWLTAAVLAAGGSVDAMRNLRRCQATALTVDFPVIDVSVTGKEDRDDTPG